MRLMQVQKPCLLGRWGAKAVSRKELKKAAYRSGMRVEYGLRAKPYSPLTCGLHVIGGNFRWTS